MDVSGSVIDASQDQPAVQPTPSDCIYLDDLLSAQEVLKNQETSDKALLDAIANVPVQVIKPRLINWASTGFQNAYTIYEIPIKAPPICSDGQTRSLQDYVQFVSGKTIHEHVDVLQKRMPDFIVSFAYSGFSILIVVSKA